MVGSEAEAEHVDGTGAVSGSRAGSSASLRFFFPFLIVVSSEASSRLLRFLLRSGSSKAGVQARMSLT